MPFPDECMFISDLNEWGQRRTKAAHLTKSINNQTNQDERFMRRLCKNLCQGRL